LISYLWASPYAFLDDKRTGVQSKEQKDQVIASSLVGSG